MKKYIILSIITAMIFTGCVKDEQPAPAPPPAEKYGDIVINELMTKDLTDPYFVDGAGDGADWIELYNKGTQAVNIAGMWVTDKPGEVADYNQIPSSDAAITTIPPNGYLVLICGAVDNEGGDIPNSIMDGKVFIDMGLSSSGDNFAAIYDPDKVEIDITDDFNGLEDDKSFGRTTDAGSEWATLASKTPGASNAGGVIPEVGKVVINEFMCSNDVWDVPGDNGDQPDWIELYNTGDTPIDIGGWYTSDALDDIMQYQLPDDDPSLTTVPAKGYLVIYCDGTGEGLHTNFKLGSGGEDIVLSKDGVEVTEGYTYCDNGCDLPNPPTDYSCGRNGDGGLTWVIFEPESATPPTPFAANHQQ